MTDMLSTLNVVYHFTSCIFIYFLNLNRYWISGNGKQGTGWDGSGSARFNETLSRNEQDTVKSVTFSKKVSKTYRSLSPRICFQFQPTVSTCHCDVEEQPTKPCSPCREQRAGGDRAAHAGEGSGQGGRSRSALLPLSPGYSPHGLSWAYPTVLIILTQSLRWLVYKIK